MPLFQVSIPWPFLAAPYRFTHDNDAEQRDRADGQEQVYEGREHRVLTLPGILNAGVLGRIAMPDARRRLRVAAGVAAVVARHVQICLGPHPPLAETALHPRMGHSRDQLVLAAAR